MNVADLLEQHARAAPGAEAIIAEGRVIRFGELDRLVKGIAARLSGAGIAPGALVAVSLPRIDPMNIALTLALARIGAISAPVATNLPRGGRVKRCRQFALDVVIAEDEDYAVDGLRFVPFAPLWQGASEADAGVAPSFEHPGQPWRLHASTGTVNRGLKAVLERHDSMVQQVIGFRASGLAGAGSRFLCGLPMTVASGIRPCLRALLGGSALVFARSESASDIAEAIDRHQVTHAMLSQLTLKDLLASLPEGGVRFPGLQRLIVGGFPTPPALVEEVTARVAPDLTAFYGATEVGLIAFAGLADLRAAEGSVGRPAPGIKVQIVDEEDRPLADGASGIIRVKGLALPEEYFRDPESTRKVFRGGWVYPGDYGHMDEGGRLWVESRVDDVVMMGGRLIDLAAIDRTLAQHPKVAEAAAFIFVTNRGETRVAAAVVARGPLEEADVLAHCRAVLGEYSVPGALRFVDRLPRNEGGKVMRHELARDPKGAEGE